jgi:serine/threonine protein kinase
LNLLKRLKNKHITKYLGYATDNDNLYLILEYVEGGSLSAVLKKFGGMKESLVASYVAQTLIGLDYLHRRGIIHRDIKRYFLF